MAIRGSGYTILETLIFLAASGLLLGAAILTIGGRQAQVQFAQSTREFEQQINDVINDVTTGYYPDISDTDNCTVGITGEPIINTGGSVKKIGTSDECIFVGKTMHFFPADPGKEDKYFENSLVGARNFNGTSVTNITNAKPIYTQPNVDTLDISQLNSLRFGVKITNIFSGSLGTSSIIKEIAFTPNLSGSSVTTTGSSFSQSVAIGVVTDPPPNFAMNTEGAVICLQDPDGRKASIGVGLNGSNNTELLFDNHDTRCG